MKALTIGRVSRKTGVAASALRYYEKTGILQKPSRISGRRVYDAGAINRIDVLRFAQEAGFSLDEIKVLFHGFDAKTPLRARWQKLARQKIEELDALSKKIARMKAALQVGLECGCFRIEDCTLSPADALDPTSVARKGGCSCSS